MSTVATVSTVRLIVWLIESLITCGEAYASRLTEHGVRVVRRRFAGQMHGFFQMVNVLPGSDAAIDFIAD